MQTLKDSSTREEAIQSAGIELASIRVLQGKTVHDIANAILLSPGQIKGIESGNQSYFYNERFYYLCIDKYAACLGLKEKLSEQIQAIEVEIQANSVEPVTVSHRSSKQHLSASVYTAIIIVAAFFILYLTPITLTNSDSPPKEPTQSAVLPAVFLHQSGVNSESSPILSESKAAEPPSSQLAINSIVDDSILLQFNGSCWVQTVEINGQKNNKTYQAGQSMKLTPKTLQALIIGNYKTASLFRSSGEEINLESYIVNGSNTVRITGKSVRQLGETKP